MLSKYKKNSNMLKSLSISSSKESKHPVSSISESCLLRQKSSRWKVLSKNPKDKKSLKHSNPQSLTSAKHLTSYQVRNNLSLKKAKTPKDKLVIIPSPNMRSSFIMHQHVCTKLHDFYWDHHGKKTLLTFINVFISYLNNLMNLHIIGDAGSHSSFSNVFMIQTKKQTLLKYWTVYGRKLKQNIVTSKTLCLNFEFTCQNKTTLWQQ